MFQFSNVQRSPCWLDTRVVQEKLTPLQKKLGITYFDYSRFYPDGSCVLYFSDERYVNSFSWDDSFVSPTCFLTPGKHLWQSYMPDIFLSNAIEHFNYAHGITYYNRLFEFDELANFSAPCANRKILSVYTNDDSVLQSFILVIRDLVSELNSSAINNRIQLPSHMLQENQSMVVAQQDVLSCFDDIVSNYTNQRKNQVSFFLAGKIITLSIREFECFRYLLQGHGQKMIANKMSISLTTVIHYSKNIYTKLDVKNHLHLLSCFLRPPSLTR